MTESLIISTNFKGKYFTYKTNDSLNGLDKNNNNLGFKVNRLKIYNFVLKTNT